MFNRFSYLNLVLAILLAIAMFAALSHIEQRQTRAISDQALEQVYLRALREFYDLAESLRSAMQRQQAADIPSSVLPYTSTRAHQGSWQLSIRLDDLQVKTTPYDRHSGQLSLTFIGNEQQRYPLVLDAHDWLAALTEDIGFGRLPVELHYRDQPIWRHDSGQQVESWFQRSDLIAPDFTLRIGRDALLQRFDRSRYVMAVSLALALISYLLLSLMQGFRRNQKQAEQRYSEVVDELDETSEFLRQQMQQTAFSQKELLKRQYELQDINKNLEQARHRLEFSERLANLGEISAGIVHEINNPVAYIGSNLRELEQDLNSLMAFVRQIDRSSDHLDVESPFYQELLAAYQQLDIHLALEDAPSRLHDSIKGVERVRKIIQDMRRLSNKGGSDKSWCNINDDIDSVVNIARSRIKGDIELQTYLIELPELYCNSSQISQVITNILVNAIQALGSQAGTITLSEKTDGDLIVIEIADDGPGMSEDIARRVFEPFFTTKGAGEGSGMGLPLCYKLVAEHRGWIDLATAPGKGACFSIYLPLNARHPPTDKETHHAE